MKKTILTLAVAGVLVACGGSATTTKAPSTPKTPKAPVNPVTYANSITADELKTHLYIYAGDEFEGRNTGDPGQVKAIEYLRDYYKNLGLSTPIDGYFQDVPLVKSQAPDMNLTVNGQTFNIGDDFVSLSQNNDTEFPFSEIVYAGYGVDDEKYSDYSNLDVKGKIVMVKAGEPKNADGTYKVTGTTDQSKWFDLRTALNGKLKAAKEKGAAGVLFHIGNAFPMLQSYYKQMAGRSSMSLDGSSDTPFFGMFVNDEVAKAVHPTFESTDTHKTVTAKGNVSYKSKSEKFTSHNVLAHVKGTEHPEEYIVISAHLDHEGIKDGKIYNGADDDGSGTVALLEIAEAFKKAEAAGNGPKRSVLFLHVTGEEKGLLGSSHYTDKDPIIPLANTVANLNVDMVGRTDPKRTEGSRNYIYLIGSDKLSTDLHNISEEVNKKYANVELDYTFNDKDDPNRFYYRSDHYNFAKNNIPVIFYFNGTHDDYHQPSDTPDKIEYDLLENRSRLIFHTAWELANRKDRIVVDKSGE